MSIAGSSRSQATDCDASGIKRWSGWPLRFVDRTGHGGGSAQGADELSDRSERHQRPATLDHHRAVPLIT